MKMQNIILLTTYNIISSLVLKTQQSGWCGARVGAASVLLLEASLIQGTSQAPPPSGLCWSCGHLELCLSVTSYVLGVRSGGCLWSLAANGTLALGAQCSSARRWWGCSCSHSSLRSRSSPLSLQSVGVQEEQGLLCITVVVWVIMAAILWSNLPEEGRILDGVMFKSGRSMPDMVTNELNRSSKGLVSTMKAACQRTLQTDEAEFNHYHTVALTFITLILGPAWGHDLWNH